jgi:guanylate kinase
MNPPAHKPLVYIISAPSGSGKSTLVNELLKTVGNLEFSISYTTRAPRGSETNGRQYYFVSRPEFERMIRDGEFLEHAEVFGNYYGTARCFLREAEQKRRDLLLDIDVQGAEQVQKKLPDATSIFILPPDRQTLERRLRNRGEDREEVIRRRLVTASHEIQNYGRYNYILINNVLDESIKNLQAIVRSERLRRAGRPLQDEEKEIAAIADRSRLDRMGERLHPILASFQASSSVGNLT